MSSGRGGARRGAPRPRAARPARSLPREAAALLPTALGVTLTVVAWGYLVRTAVDVASDAASAGGGAWLVLATAVVGAVACLFLALLLAARLVTRLRTRHSQDPADSPGPAGSSGSPGGRRRR